MSEVKRGLVFELASDVNPILVGVDYGAGDDITTECEVEMLPDGGILVKDIRQIPEPPIAKAKGGA